MSDHLAQAFATENLRRAWLWIRTSSEPLFKDYFRDVYDAYAVAAEANLDCLGRRLRRGSFQPVAPCKAYFPKKSGVLRAYTLLAVEDQIVYQALANLVAEKLAPKVRHRYEKQVFGHLYAGRNSPFFYRRWQDGYRTFSERIRQAHRDGHVHAASFDLVACYDSMCHTVLGSFLKELGLDEEFVQFLLHCLAEWTRPDPREGVCQGHGIPQGPLPSGLLAEVILKHFDDKTRGLDTVRYFRYVDDIRLYGRNEHDLRHLLVELDLLSKTIGLFPQSTKIGIHRVTDIEGELKSVSVPPELGVTDPDPDQAAVHERLRELTNRYRIDDETRFKWVLSRAEPRKPLSRRLLRLLPSYPHLYRSISRYFGRHAMLPTDIAADLLELLAEEDVYTAPCASLLREVLGRVPVDQIPAYIQYAREHLRRAESLAGGPELRAACAAWLLRHHELSFSDTEKLILECPHWWVQKELVAHLDREHIGDPSYQAVLNRVIRGRSADPALVAAYGLATQGLQLARPKRGIQELAQRTLREFGLLRRVAPPPCDIAASHEAVLRQSPCGVPWRNVFGAKYRQARRLAIQWRSYAETDITAWVNITDTIHDLLLEALYGHDPWLGTYTLGNIGAVLNAPTGKLATKYPAVYVACEELHEKRLASHLSHPEIRQTGGPTGRIRFSYLHEARPLLVRAYRELGQQW